MFSADEVYSQYQYSFCEISEFQNGVHTCLSESIRTVDVSPIQPPFLYNNQCTSIMLISYIPVYVFVYAIEFVGNILLTGYLLCMDYENIPKWLRVGVKGVFWPNHNWYITESDSDFMLNATEIIYFDILKHLVVFVTFAMACPYLAIILLLTVLMKLYLWRFVIGRFAYEKICKINGGEGEQDDGLALVKSACVPIIASLEVNMRPIVMSSAVLYSFICWDIAGDDIGWRESFWAPMTILIFPILLWTSLCLFERWENWKNAFIIAIVDAEVHDNTSGSSLNPMLSANGGIELKDET